MFGNDQGEAIAAIRELDLGYKHSLDDNLPDGDELTFLLEQESKNETFLLFPLDLAKAVCHHWPIYFMGFYQVVFITWHYALGQLDAVIWEPVVNLGVKNVNWRQVYVGTVLL